MFFHLAAPLVASAQVVPDPPIYPGQDRTYPFHSAAGSADTTAISKNDPSLVAWATGYQDLSYGVGVADNWKTPSKALGPAEGSAFDIVTLGRGGQITLTFAKPITDGAGFDFAVFENSFSDGFLELAWVEVSSDGSHFVRFPNLSYTYNTVGPFGANIDPTMIHGLAGKYRAGYGTPFDLSQLQVAYDAAIADTDIYFTAAYEALLEANFPFLDLSDIRYVRLIDIVGDATARDIDGNVVDASGNEGAIIYDPFPTIGSAGFDLDAVGVLNQTDPSVVQSITFPNIGNRRLTDGLVTLSANATSGLPVTYVVMEGPAAVSGSTLTLTGLGQVIIQATQAGDVTYAPAVPLTQSFFVADELQHIFLLPVANQTVDAADVLIDVISSSGLPVSLFIDSGPPDAAVTESTHIFTSSSVPGTVILRASLSSGESGGVTYAPAADVAVEFEIVAAGSSKASRTFSEWQADNNITGTHGFDSDQNGISNLEEYAAGTNPKSASDRPSYLYEQPISGQDFTLELVLCARARIDLDLETSSDLSDAQSWAVVIPEILSIQNNSAGARPTQTVRMRLPSNSKGQQFWKFIFNEK
ncbi:MAG: hypothetical protein ACJ0BK_00995 [Coraliomargaritaceae bacterium]